MTPAELAAIVERDAETNGVFCRHCDEYGPPEAEADRRALLGLLRETREALTEFGEHSSRCLVWRQRPCDCGFTAVLAALGPP